MNLINYFVYEKCLCISIVLAFFISVKGEITVAPSDTEASVGEDAIIFCSIASGSCEWYHLPIGETTHEILYLGGHIYNGYKERFNISKPNDNVCNLVITDVRIIDAGLFTCIEASTGTSQKTAEFIVFEKYPSNKTCVTKITCAPACNDLELSCGMKSYGNIKPVMEWRDDAGNLVKSTFSQDITTSIIHLKEVSLLSPTYTCQVKFPTKSLSSQYLWSYSTSVSWFSTTPTTTEKPQQDTVFTGLVMTFVVISTVSILCVILLLIYIWKIRRQLKNCVNTAGISRVENSLSESVENGQTPENTILLAEDEDDCKTVFVPRTSENKDKAIRGLGVLDDEVFLTTRGSCVIEVFDLHTVKYKRIWKVEGLTDANDMATFPAKGLIFICDWKKLGENKEIFCVDKNGKLKHRWISESERGRISVTKECNVIVSESWYNTIREYSMSGHLLHKFVTGKQKLHLWHAVKLDNGNLVASFGDRHDEIQEICVIDSTGKTLSSTTKYSLSPFGVRLSVPRSLAVDKNGCIYVCDLYNGRIIVLTSELECKGVIDTTENNEKLRNPHRVCMYESGSTRQLLVADSLNKNGKWIDGRILVWNLGSGSSEQMRQSKETILSSKPSMA